MDQSLLEEAHLMAPKGLQRNEKNPNTRSQQIQRHLADCEKRTKLVQCLQDSADDRVNSIDGQPLICLTNDIDPCL